MMSINSKQSLILTVFLILILVVGSSTLRAQNSSDEMLFNKKLETPTNVEDLIAKFNFLEYNMAVMRGGEKVQDSIISYQYEGEEEVEEVKTDKVSFDIKNNISDGGDMPSNMVIWFDGNEIIQMVVDGESLSPRMVDMMGKKMLKFVLAPFYSFKELNVKELKEIGKVSRSQETISDQELDIIKIEVEDIPEYEIESTETKLAEFEEFIIAISYNYVSSKEDMEVEFNTEKLELH